MLQKNKYELSIIIPVFNEERYLERLFFDLVKYFNKEFGYSDDINSLVNSDGDSVSKDEGSLKSKFNSKNSRDTKEFKL